MSFVGHTGGAGHAQFWRVDQYLRMAGQATDPDNIAAGTTVHARKLVGYVGYDIQEPERQRVDFFDGDSVVGSMFFGADEPPSGSMDIETVDAILRSMAEGGNVDTTTNALWVVWGSNALQPVPRTLGACFSRPVQSRESGSDGDLKWLNEIYLLQLSMRNPSSARVSKGQASIGLTAIAQSRFPNGIPFGVNQSFYNNRTFGLYVVTDNPLAFTTFIADGVATGYTLAYLPTSDVVGAGSTNNFQAINNAEVAPASVNTGTGAVTLAAAGSSGDFVSMMYETAFVPV